MKVTLIGKIYRGIIRFMEDDALQDKLFKGFFKVFAFYIGFQILRAIGDYIVDILIAAKYGSNVL